MMLASIRNGLTLALLTVAAGTGTAFAHPNAGELDVGLFGGYHIFGTENILGSEKGDTVGTIDDGPIFGLRVGYVVVSRIGVEAEGGMFLSNPRVQFDQDVIGFHARGNVTLRITPDDLGGDLFLLGGAGIMTVGKSDDGLLKSDTKFMPHFGLGANVEVGDHWGLRFDGRAFISKNTSDDTQMTYEGLIGFYYAFGRKPHETAPAKPLDGDGDGINDDVDKCPTEAEDADNFQDDDGCPDPDNDGDGILDASDKCVNEPETKNNYQDEDGCPDTIPAQVQKYTGIIQGINFKFNSAEITRKSYPVLDRAAKVLSDYPDVRIEIQGHTDNKGKAEYNKDLSQRRAESVKNYFISKGIDQARLSATGYGQEVPIADNKTNKGRAKNRRVEFKLK